MQTLVMVAAVDGTAELRGWVTVAWAIVVGLASLIGVSIAVRNYLESTWQIKVAAARRMYCAVTEAHDYPAQNDVGSRIAQTTFSFGRDSHIERLHDRTNSLRYRAKGDVTQFLLHIVNKSDEPMGDVDLAVVAAHGSVLSRHRLSAVTPGSDFRVELLAEPDETGGRAQIMLEYTDSAGNRWQRAETNPPRLFVMRTRKQLKRDRAPLQADPYMY